MKNKEIAQQLSLTEHTVSNYMYRIFDKLGMSSRLQLLLYAMSKQEETQPELAKTAAG
jgi:DNA-binding NarL/FixJ family response regulator